MQKFLVGFLAVIVTFLIVAVIAVAGGTILYLLYLACRLTWWQAVLIVWFFALLIKSSHADNKSK
jgi:hypothetical protein